MLGTGEVRVGTVAFGVGEEGPAVRAGLTGGSGSALRIGGGERGGGDVE